MCCVKKVWYFFQLNLRLTRANGQYFQYDRIKDNSRRKQCLALEVAEMQDDRQLKTKAFQHQYFLQYIQLKVDYGIMYIEQKIGNERDICATFLQKN